ncbi:hypothetical protein H8F21_14050 [Pseudomonas sp. P66]|uniref:DUF2798 domain-containing protein n=1 Tax=Pseudomonas arcuscaelestis TaxID=2710591 RepID=A0ABS2BYJ3_9PSED|nr:hypothetical protein [Pseudomonas arcuscaelestis]MBM5458687.1 hypothetical protein [Pseudomonas arcuscaelestis]
MTTVERIRNLTYRLSKIICLVIFASLMIWLSPGADYLRSIGLQSDLIRMVMLGGAVLPALFAAAILRMLIAPPAPEAGSTN